MVWTGGGEAGRWKPPEVPTTSDDKTEEATARGSGSDDGTDSDGSCENSTRQLASKPLVANNFRSSRAYGASQSRGVSRRCALPNGCICY